MKARIIFTLLLASFFSSSYATLEECYSSGEDKNYEKSMELCKPYLKTDARATGYLAEAHIQLDEGDKVALEDALWALDFYKKNGIPTDKGGIRAYSYLVYLVGELYFFGADDVKVDQQKGLNYMIKAANLGYSVAQNQLGNLYVRAGKVPPPNFAKAYKWYKLAIANGNLDARNAFLIKNKDSFIRKYPYCISQGRALIGDAYMKGQAALPKNIDYAISWYNRANDASHISPVEAKLAEAYLAKGDAKTALIYAKEAVQQPYAPAFVAMSKLVKDDVTKYAYLLEAIELYEHADHNYWDQYNEYCQPDLSDRGEKKAKAMLANIKLSSEDIALAKKKQTELKSHWQKVITVY